MPDPTVFLAEWARAERTANIDFLDAALTDDFLAVGPLGFVLTKPDWLARLRSGDLVYETFALDDLETRLYGTTAIVTARQTTRGAYRGSAVPEALRATLVLLHDDMAWRLAAIHMSFVAGTPGAPPIPAAA